MDDIQVQDKDDSVEKLIELCQKYSITIPYRFAEVVWKKYCSGWGVLWTDIPETRHIEIASLCLEYLEGKQYVDDFIWLTPEEQLPELDVQIITRKKGSEKFEIRSRTYLIDGVYWSGPFDYLREEEIDHWSHIPRMDV